MTQFRDRGDEIRANMFKSERQIGIGSETIEKYIGYFEESFLIEKAVCYDVKGRKYIRTPAKYYYTDLGLRNARLGFRQLEEKMVVVRDYLKPWQDENGITYVGIERFLLNEELLK